MRVRFPLVAILVTFASGYSEALTVKRAGGTGPVSVELAQNSSEPVATTASRFVELSHASRGRSKDPDEGCTEEGCSFTEESLELLKTHQQKMAKKVKKLKKKIKKQKKIYLETHPAEDYEVLKEQAVLDALMRENSGGSEGPQEGEEATEGGGQ